MCEISRERSPNPFTCFAMRCTAARMLCMPCTVSCTASRPFSVAVRACWALSEEVPAVEATCRMAVARPSTAARVCVDSCSCCWDIVAIWPAMTRIARADSLTRMAASFTWPSSLLNRSNMRLNASARFPNMSAVTSPRRVRSPLLTSDTNMRNSIVRFCIALRSASLWTKRVIRSSMVLNALAIWPSSSCVSSLARAWRCPEAACMATSAMCVTPRARKRATRYPKLTPKTMAKNAPPITLIVCLCATA